MVLVRFQHQPLLRQLTQMCTHTATDGSDATSNRFHAMPLVVGCERCQAAAGVSLARTPAR